MRSRKREVIYKVRPSATLAPGRANGWWRKLSILCLILAAGVVLLPLITTRAAAQEVAPSYSVLYSFTGGPDGANPYAGLIADAAGNFYGTSYFGGNTSSSCPAGPLGCGVVFKMDPSGIETVLYTFSGGADGADPGARLIRDTAGNLYGTTVFGGNTSSSCPEGSNGCGVVFKLDPSGNETVLYTFSGGADGATPSAGLVRDGVGNLYRTTGYGGSTSSSCSNGPFGCGVVFKLDSSGKERVLHTFSGPPDGANPYAGLIADAAGNFYGTTLAGGNTSSSCLDGANGCGVVFKLDPAGQHYRVLYAFSGGADGTTAYAGLVRDRAGNLYGTTTYGGDSGSSCPNGVVGCGVVFKLDPSGIETVLHTFSGGADGASPNAALTRDAAGDLYGTVSSAGDLTCNSPYGCGTVFKLDPSGNYRVLHTFSGADGAEPYADLLPYKGSLYGTAIAHGAYGYGVVFRLKP